MAWVYIGSMTVSNEELRIRKALVVLQKRGPVAPPPPRRHGSNSGGVCAEGYIAPSQLGGWEAWKDEAGSEGTRDCVELERGREGGREGG